MVRWLEEGEVPDADEPDEEGLVALGGSLDPDVLVASYARGIFPWSEDPVLNWWSPDPRAIFDLRTWRPSRSVRQSIRRGGWRFTMNTAFGEVIRACAAPAAGRPETWISPAFIAAYTELHRRGHAMSVEVWEGPALVGGLYGVVVGGLFAGESMFHRATDASKAALAHLVEQLRGAGFGLLDAQAPHEHLLGLGAVTVSRRMFLRRLRAAVAKRPAPGWWR